MLRFALARVCVPTGLLALTSLLTLAGTAPAGTHEVRGAAELKAALPRLADGDTLRIHPGDYPGGNFVANLGNLTVEAADPANPPHFRGGNQGWHFSRCAQLTVRNLRISGQSGNGINLDDAAPDRGAVPGITLENLHISDIGPVGNFDAIKCSGLTGLTIRDCQISGWGGQAIDLVGCQKVRISNCRIVGKPGFSQHTGPQFKGGCEDVTLEDCELVDAGPRPIQAGGSTGLEFFRPLGAKFEARRIIIRNNRIDGGQSACAFTGVDGAEFSGNTITRPGKWIFRILAETTGDGFAPTRNVHITNNTITFRRAEVTTELNIGPHTAPETFVFADNLWYAEDRPEASKPTLPVKETGAIYDRPQR
jgi:polygalacturonase